MEGDRPESADTQGRICSICFLPKGEEMDCSTCCHIGNRLANLHHDHDDTSLFQVIEALKEWSQDAPTWDILYWLNQFLQPSVTRGSRMSGSPTGDYFLSLRASMGLERLFT